DEDVLQHAMLRLWKALERRTPETARDFLGLAAGLIRRELIDLLRHYYGPGGPAAHHHSDPGVAEAAGASSGAHSANLAARAEVHEAVEALPAEEREVVGLLWYHQLEQAEAAQVLGVDVRTVKRWWKNARLHLHEALKGEGPRI